MQFLELVQKRRSVRSYQQKPVPQEALQQVLEAARLAPSARNAQAWKFVVVQKPETRRQIAEVAGGQQFIAEAPIVIAAVGLDPERIMHCGVPPYAVDVAIAVEHMALAAAELGLGTCWIGHFDQDKVRSLLGIPSKYKVVALLPLGYPADTPRPKSRKSLSGIISYEQFVD